MEILAGIPGTPVAELGYGGDWFVCQYMPEADDGPHIYGPLRDDGLSAIRAWNAMVRRIRKANAQGLFYLRWWRHRAQYSLPERIGCYRAHRNQPLEQDGEAMNVYVWDRISRVSNSYHEEGGVVVFAETEDRARELANEIEGCEIEPTDVVTDVRSVRGGVEKVYIFPDAGCC